MEYWQGQFLSVMEDYIPKGVLPKRKHPPWITKQIRSAIYKWNQLYQRLAHLFSVQEAQE